MLKLWLREPHHSDDEAIKLMIDEEMDVSDVLLKVPELLRVQQLKPSEIQAEYNDRVLSNRMVVSSVFEGNKEGTFVIRPRPGVVVTPNGVWKESPVSRVCGGGRRGAPSSCTTNSYPPPSPRRNQFDKNHITNPEMLKRTGSLGGDRGRPPVARSTSRGATPPRGVGGGTPRCRKSNIGGYQNEGNTPNRTATPKRGASVPRSDRQPTVRSRHLDPKNVASRFRQEAEKVRAPSKRNQVEAVCESFKPQWGKPLCATCNHPRQAHWEAQRRKNSEVEPNSSSEIDVPAGVTAQIGSMTPNRKVMAAIEVGSSQNQMVVASAASISGQEEW
ncbi:hypothetical protein TraAM80_09133 [Trypanosoma rangeli]|uniref:Uncharacterized protein n=1 Tax=Trypanosoma rangeli TaxID=5698 RepID=A0A422MX82_TRYRA|nr:uncharacterized protein TraAM80_09133 [Trypanosoma rangeli]RNE97800.1 hypothetical protein TraAM80_09133 [Trypanosoma rangeli]|eukprot:RNE97800.1 hypothetical protein TraAM80_09133 [Trypanosoma rangeli]